MTQPRQVTAYQTQVDGAYKLNRSPYRQLHNVYRGSPSTQSPNPTRYTPSLFA